MYFIQNVNLKTTITHNNLVFLSQVVKYQQVGA